MIGNSQRGMKGRSETFGECNVLLIERGDDEYVPK
jgi:hypothetical protein